jgi:hypothetical protein
MIGLEAIAAMKNEYCRTGGLILKKKKKPGNVYFSG